MKYFSELLNILNAMSPYLLLGFFIAGLMYVYIPQSTFSRYLSRRGFRSVFLAALFGVPLPLCSCGVIPTAMSLKKEGASDGATVSFLIATPQTGVDSILATYGVLGLPFAILRPIVAFIVALCGGMLVDRMSVEQPSEPQSGSCAVPARRTFVDALRYGFVDMLQDLGKWLTIGLVIAAAITIFVPDTIFTLFDQYYALNILVVLLLSVPMYICSTGSIPIALSLLLKGISPGAALVFLMAGPATNVATLAVVRKVLGRRTTLLYLLSITVGAVLFALLIDFVLPVEWFTTKLRAVASCNHSETTSWWHLASSILFIGLLINAYIHKLRHGGHHHDDPSAESSKSEREFQVVGIRCNHCKANIEKALLALPDVETAEANVTSGIVQVLGTASNEQIVAAIKSLGFEVD